MATLVGQHRLAKKPARRAIVGASPFLCAHAGHAKKRAAQGPLKLLSASGHEEPRAQKKSFGKWQWLHAETFVEVANLQQHPVQFALQAIQGFRVKQAKSFG